jgi:hypothetical protein
MGRILKFLLLVVLLNVVRYALGWPLEKLLIFDRLFGAMAASEGYFNMQFSALDWTTSFFYNFMMWATVSVIYIKIQPVVHGSPIRKSLKVYGVMFIFFASVSAIYMNHYTHPKDFYLYNILDGMLVFPLVAVANGLIHPRLFKISETQKQPRPHAPAHPPLAGHFPAAQRHSPDPSA